MKKIVFIISVSFLFFTSCQKTPSNIFIGETKYIASFPRTDSLMGDSITIDNFGANTIHVIDSFMVFAGGQLDTFYRVCSKYDYHHLGNYIPKGRGASELPDISFPIFCQYDADEAKIFLQDRGNSLIKTFNITQSVKAQKTIFDNEDINIKFLPGLKAIFPIDDSLFFVHYFNYKNEKECYTLMNMNSHVAIYEDTIYTDKLSRTGNIFLWNTFSRMKPDKTQYATAMQFFNQINIYNVGAQKALAIVPYEKITTLKDAEETIMPEKMEYYSDLIGTDSQIWALYANQNRKDWATKEGLSTEIHVLDWEGNPLMKLIIPQKIAKIALDEEQKLLYGMTLSEQVFRYNVGEILE